MVENVSLYEYTIFSTFKGKSVTTIGIHENELDVLFLIEVAILIYELIIIVIEMLTQFVTCLMSFSLKVVELLIRFREGNIEHCSFLLLRFE